jgi:periplasmic protein TonB
MEGVMHNTGYLATRPRRSGVLTGVVAIHVAGLTAMLMVSPYVADVIDPPPLVTRNIALQPDPPVIPPDDKPVVKSTRPDDRIMPKSPVLPSKPTEGSFARDPGPLNGAGSAEGIGDAFKFPPIDPPKDPVIVGPQFSGRNAQPPYPPGLQRLAIEGRVTVRVLVGVDGRPVRIEVVQTDHDGFLTATRDWGMRHWRFAPATRDGMPFQEWRTMTVRFSMT